MSDSRPLIEIVRLEKRYGAADPLRVTSLRLGATDRIVVSGIDLAAAETLINLITGASVPDAGDVLVAGRNTRDIATDTEWLASLDRFGIVTGRAILVSPLSIGANLALPMTLSVDPMAPETERAVHALADETGIPRARLSAPAESLSPAERVRAHIARAIAIKPEALLLEHPTSGLGPADSAAIAAMVRAVVESRRLALIAVSDDDAFGRALGMRRLRLDGATGQLRVTGGLLAKLGLR